MTDLTEKYGEGFLTLGITSFYVTFFNGENLFQICIEGVSFSFSWKRNESVTAGRGRSNYNLFGDIFIFCTFGFSQIIECDEVQDLCFSFIGFQFLLVIKQIRALTL